MDPIEKVKSIVTTGADALSLWDRLRTVFLWSWSRITGRSKPLDGVALDVTVFEHNSESAQDATDHITRLSYRIETREKETRIVPKMDYLSILAAGGPIPPIQVPGEPFSWGWPTLDITVTNNSGQTLTLTRAEFVVRRSVTNPEPVPVFVKSERHNALRMGILNEGWGAVLNGRLRFNLIPYNDFAMAQIASQGDFTELYAYELRLPDFTDDTDVDLSDVFEREGVDIAVIRSFVHGAQIIWTDDRFRVISALKRSFADSSTEVSEALTRQVLGKFTSGDAVIYGEMHYAWDTSDGERRDHCVRFYNSVWLVEEPGTGTGMFPTEDYDIEVRADDHDYQVTKPLHQVLESQEADRFTMRVKIPCSSEHWFHIRFRCNDRQMLTSEPMYLRAFVPRSSASQEYPGCFLTRRNQN